MGRWGVPASRTRESITLEFAIILLSIRVVSRDQEPTNDLGARICSKSQYEYLQLRFLLEQVRIVKCLHRGRHTEDEADA